MKVCNIDKADCLQCDVCKDLCPVNAIKIDENGDYYIDEELCAQAGGFDECGLCVEDCAVEAIKGIEFKQV